MTQMITNQLLMDMKNRIDNMYVDEALDFDLEIFLAVKSKSMINLRSQGVAALAVRHGFQYYLEHFLEFNAASDAPYHNLYHTCCMVLNCFEGAYHEKLDESALRSLLVAALFHDYDHSAGQLTDDKNIERAISGLRIAHKYAESKGQKLTDVEFDLAISTIKITEYPFLKDPFFLNGQIIRDADLMQLYEPVKEIRLNQYLGLKNEIKILKGEFTNEQFADGMDVWLDSNVVWYTTWAKEKAVEIYDDAKSSLITDLRQ